MGSTVLRPAAGSLEMSVFHCDGKKSWLQFSCNLKDKKS